MDDAWWLLIIAVLFAIAAIALPRIFRLTLGSELLLLLLGLLSGVLAALQTANNNRAVNGRVAVAEPPAFDEIWQFLAVAGFSCTLVL